MERVGLVVRYGLLVGVDIRRVPVWIYLLIIGVATFCTREIVIVPDMGSYMISGLNIAYGKGYTGMSGALIWSRAPLFSLLISGSYFCLGASPWSAFWVVRLFAILNPLLIYFLGKKLFGKLAGFSGALLILSSYSVNYWSYRHLDAVWPFFTIFSIVCLYVAIENGDYIYFAISGIFLALAYLIKQAPILLIPLPFILIFFVKEYRNQRNIRGALLWILLFSFITFPWIFYVYRHTYNILFSILGTGGKVAADAYVNSSPFLFMERYFAGLWAYYRGGGQFDFKSLHASAIVYIFLGLYGV